MYLSKPAKSLIVAVFAVMIFTIASVWVTSQQIKADTITDASTSITDTTPVNQPLAADAAATPTTSPTVATSPDAVAQTATDTTPSPNLASLATTDSDTDITATTLNDPATATKSRASLHYGILIADGILVLILLAILTFRLLGKFLSQPNTALTSSANAPQIAASGRPVTIDDLKLDIPA